MTWIFGSLLVTPRVLTSCHVVVSKPGNASVQSGPKGEYRDENHGGRFTQSAENLELSEGYATGQRRLGLRGGASVGTPWLTEEGMGQKEVPSLSICLSINLSTNSKLWTPYGNKMRDIFL